MKKAIIVTDLGFGDSNKGVTIQALTRRHRAKVVIRFSGGCQAGHNIVLEDGTHHTFAQFGSGTFDGARTHLSQFMVVHPKAMEIEASYLQRRANIQDPFQGVTVDRRALVISPFHQSMNRLLELSRGAASHGTCGAGVGQTVGDAYDYPEDAIRVGDLLDTKVLREKLLRIQARKVQEAQELKARTPGSITHDPKFMEEMTVLSFADISWVIDDFKIFARRVTVTDENYLRDHVFAADGVVLFEGAQGVLLDEWHGFHPHTTYTNTTHDNALTLLREGGYDGDVTRLGLLRSYLTRHGQGPFPTETTDLRHAEIHNNPKCWQGAWRQGHLDVVLARYAIEACGGVDGLVIGHMDCVGRGWNICPWYEDAEGQPHGILPVGRDRVVNGYQDGNTALLRGMTPKYLFPENHPVVAEEALAAIQSILHEKVVMTSHGMTASDRVFHDSHL